MFIAIFFELHRWNPKTSSHKSLWNAGKSVVSKNEHEKIIIIIIKQDFKICHEKDKRKSTFFFENFNFLFE